MRRIGKTAPDVYFVVFEVVVKRLLVVILVGTGLL